MFSTCTIYFITSTVSITRFDATASSWYAFSSCDLPLLSVTKSDKKKRKKKRKKRRRKVGGGNETTLGILKHKQKYF